MIGRVDEAARAEGILAIVFDAVNADGAETEHRLPACYGVCARCEGHGTHLRDGIREHAYTAEEFDEAFPDDESAAEYFKRGGRYDVQCTDCKGLRVVLVVDRERVKGSFEYREAWRAYRQREREDALYDSICESERRFGC